VEQWVECPVSESYAVVGFDLLFYLVPPHGSALYQPEYLDVKQVLGDALYNSFFDDFGQVFTLWMCSVLYWFMFLLI